MREYWEPAALPSELPEPEGSPLRVRLLGEDLVAYREHLGRSDAMVIRTRKRLIDAACWRLARTGWKRPGSCARPA